MFALFSGAANTRVSSDKYDRGHKFGVLKQHVRGLIDRASARSHVVMCRALPKLVWAGRSPQILDRLNYKIVAGAGLTMFPNKMIFRMASSV
jgi:hypothetical protein